MLGFFLQGIELSEARFPGSPSTSLKDYQVARSGRPLDQCTNWLHLKEFYYAK